MSLLQARINNVWVDLPTPAHENYSSTYTHIENTFRSANGILKREIVRRNLAKVFCGYNSLTGEQMALLQSLYEFDNFDLRYTDTYNQRVIKKMYAGVLDGKAALLNPADLTIKSRTGTQMNFIEV